MPTPAIAANAYAALAQLRDQSAGLSRDAAGPAGGLDFGSMLKDVVTNVTAIGRKSDAQAQAVAMGKGQHDRCRDRSGGKRDGDPDHGRRPRQGDRRLRRNLEDADLKKP